MTGEDEGDGRADRGPPVTVTAFMNENYRLFTMISVFAALSVYLSDLADADTGAVRLGIGAALVLFLVSSVAGVVRAYRATERVLHHPDAQSKLWVFPHALLMYALFFLTVSIFRIIETRYPGEVADVLASGIMYTLIFVYWAFVSREEQYEGFTRGPELRRLLPQSPYLSLLPTAVWAYLGWDGGSLVLGPDRSAAVVVGFVFGVVLVHLLATAGIVLAMVGVDRLVLDGDGGSSGSEVDEP
ncbi:hypothetical protein [Halorarum salinum]|uniref:Uncharacterized protein n=1 Tax=Halorarum salinum TaxID=2743089 RepID=A0A7D5QH97_9EURY|nr:hypothetical protein [Halobaculum salinum]QLG62763.1 hypothetical protein HUG12_13920 [Halobaculum salinum]